MHWTPINLPLSALQPSNVNRVILGLFTLLVFQIEPGTAQELPAPKADIALSPSENQLLLETVELETLKQSLGPDHPQVRSVASRVKALQKVVDDAHGELGGANRSANPYLLQQLALERAKYEELLTKVGAGHPHAKNLVQQIRELERQIAEVQSDRDPRSAEVVSQLVTERSKLAELLKVFGAEHPQVKSTQARIAVLEKNHPAAAPGDDPLPINLPTNHPLRSQIAIAEAKLAELKQTVGEDHPTLKRTAMRIRLFDSIFKDRILLNQLDSNLIPNGENDLAHQPNSIPYLRNRYQIDRMLTLRVAKELEKIQSEFPNDSSRWKETMQKLEWVARDALESRQTLVQAEIDSLRRMADEKEGVLQESKRDPVLELQKFLQELPKN